jgi:carnosine N-methyltransferase
MLTAEEFRLFFENSGYTTILDRIVETPHLEDHNSFSYKIYRNWLFIAKKNNEEYEEYDIQDDSILKINTPIYYERKGILKNGEIELETLLKLPGGVFNNAKPVIQILKLIDGKKSFNEILTLLKDNGFSMDNLDEIKALISDFLKKKILHIIK